MEKVDIALSAHKLTLEAHLVGPVGMLLCVGRRDNMNRDDAKSAALHVSDSFANKDDRENSSSLDNLLSEI